MNLAMNPCFAYQSEYIFIIQKYPENFALQLFSILHQVTRETCYFL